MPVFRRIVRCVAYPLALPGRAAGAGTAFLARACGASESGADRVRKVTRVVVGAGVGFYLGGLASGYLVSAAAAPGLSGAAATSNGLASLGGGAVAAGGGGMAAGQAVVAATNTAATLIGGSTGLLDAADNQPQTVQPDPLPDGTGSPLLGPR